MTVGGLVDTVFRFNRLCECHLYTALRNNTATCTWFVKDVSGLGEGRTGSE
jgi:hypothetical protein